MLTLAFVPDQRGATALVCASQRGCAKSVRALLAVDGIDLTVKAGPTALMCAAHQGSTECVEALLRANGVDANAHGRVRYTMRRGERLATVKCLRLPVVLHHDTH